MRDGRIEKLLITHDLGAYTNNVGITIKGSNFLKYTAPITKSKTNNFYQSSFKSWQSLNPNIKPYTKNNVQEDLKVFYNPSLVNKDNSLFSSTYIPMSKYSKNKGSVLITLTNYRRSR